MDIIFDISSFMFLYNCEPTEVEYGKYWKEQPYLIMAGHLTRDLYYLLIRALAFLRYGSIPENYKKLSGQDEVSQLFAQSQMLTSSLLLYAMIPDYVWQIAWAYTDRSKEFRPITFDGYADTFVECRFRHVVSRLSSFTSENETEKNAVNQLYEIILEINNNAMAREINELSNHVKHRGCLFFEGVGFNLPEFHFTVNGVSVPRFTRRQTKAEELINLLKTYHSFIVGCLSRVVSAIFPADFFDQTTDINEYLGAVVNLLRMPRAIDQSSVENEKQ